MGVREAKEEMKCGPREDGEILEEYPSHAATCANVLGPRV